MRSMPATVRHWARHATPRSLSLRLSGPDGRASRLRECNGARGQEEPKEFDHRGRIADRRASRG